MSVKEQAIDAIHRLPEVSLMTGIEEAAEEIKRGKGMTAAEAKKQLSEWLSR